MKPPKKNSAINTQNISSAEDPSHFNSDIASRDTAIQATNAFVPEEALGYLLDANRANALAKRVYSAKDQTLDITRAVIFLTNECNMNCRYCKSKKHQMEEWRDDDLYSLLETLSKGSTKHVQWTGGEVTTHPRLNSFILKSSELGMNNSISTNGTASLKTYIDLAEAGVLLFSISIDQPNESIFDKITQTKGNFSKVVDTIEGLCRYNIKTGQHKIIINSVLTKETVYNFMGNNARWLKEFLEWCQNIGVDDFKFLPEANIPIDRLFTCPQAQKEFMGLCRSIVPLKYKLFHFRLSKLQAGGHGLQGRSHYTCYHCLDDRAYDSSCAYPCIIQLREGGKHLYKHSDSPSVKHKALNNFFKSDRSKDPVCRTYCFDLYRYFSDHVNFLLQSEDIK